MVRLGAPARHDQRFRLHARVPTTQRLNYPRPSFREDRLGHQLRQHERADARTAATTEDEAEGDDREGAVREVALPAARGVVAMTMPGWSSYALQQRCYRRGWVGQQRLSWEGDVRRHRRRGLASRRVGVRPLRLRECHPAAQIIKTLERTLYLHEVAVRP